MISVKAQISFSLVGKKKNAYIILKARRKCPLNSEYEHYHSKHTETKIINPCRKWLSGQRLLGIAVGYMKHENMTWY